MLENAYGPEHPQVVALREQLVSMLEPEPEPEPEIVSLGLPLGEDHQLPPPEISKKGGLRSRSRLRTLSATCPDDGGHLS